MPGADEFVTCAGVFGLAGAFAEGEMVVGELTQGTALFGHAGQRLRYPSSLYQLDHLLPEFRRIPTGQGGLPLCLVAVW